MILSDFEASGFVKELKAIGSNSQKKIHLIKPAKISWNQSKDEKNREVSYLDAEFVIPKTNDDRIFKKILRIHNRQTSDSNNQSKNSERGKEKLKI